MKDLIPPWAQFKHAMGQFCVAVEMTVVHNEMMVFGYCDPSCTEEEFEDRNPDRTKCSYHPSGKTRPTCRPWVLTPVIDAAIKGMDAALTWCEDTGEGAFETKDAIEHIIDHLNWSQVETVLEQYGYDSDWLAERLEFFEKWIEFFYFGPRELECLYEGVKNKWEE